MHPSAQLRPVRKESTVYKAKKARSSARKMIRSNGGLKILILSDLLGSP